MNGIKSLEKSIQENIRQIVQKFPNTTIIPSTLFPHNEGKFKKEIQEVNNLLETLSNQTKNINIMNNKYIDEKYLKDKKHLNKSGFFRFLVNIRFTIFGHLPKVKTYSRNKVRKYNW